jgi:hypothetical protein
VLQLHQLCSLPLANPMAHSESVGSSGTPHSSIDTPREFAERKIRAALSVQNKNHQEVPGEDKYSGTHVSLQPFCCGQVVGAIFPSLVDLPRSASETMYRTRRIIGSA